MKVTSSVIALASVAVGVSAQGVPTGIAPAGGSPAGCFTTGTGKYQVQNVMPPGSEKRGLESRAVDCSDPNALTVMINNGIMTDSQGRIAEIVANRQFQFDGPPAQTGSIYTGGWSVCSNGSLAIGPTTNFWQCLSGNFYNIYDQAVRSDCIPIKQQLLECAGNTGSGSTASVSGGSVAASSSAAASASMSSMSSAASNMTMTMTMASSATKAVTQVSDGQPQATSASNITATTSRAPLPTGGAAQIVASGAVVAIGAAAAFFL